MAAEGDDVMTARLCGIIEWWNVVVGEDWIGDGARSGEDSWSRSRFLEG